MYLTLKIDKLVAFKERSLAVKNKALPRQPACRKLLLFIDRVKARSHCNELAATCLPRSYKIANGNAPSPTS
jgi:hypothetical protein